MNTPANIQQLAFDAGAVFTPGAPINARELFAGRVPQIKQLMNAISQRGYHSVLYGERGVGKTSLSNVLQDYLRDVVGNRLLITRVNCDAGDNFTKIWHKALRDISLPSVRPAIGLTGEPSVVHSPALGVLPNELVPDDIRRFLALPSFQGLLVVFIFDEFDRINSDQTTALMADTIKMLSDYSMEATIMLVGVADSVDELIHEHQSVERALIQVPMPRMSNDEIKLIITNGLQRLGMTIHDEALDEIDTLSQGIPYITHLLGLHSTKVALGHGRTNISLSDLSEAIELALAQWQQSVSSTYLDAVSSHQPDAMYKEVLLACALTKADEMGFFAAAPVRSALSIITGKKYDVTGYAGSLKEFTTQRRAKILHKVGEVRRQRYRFTSPLMKPYIIMRGFADGLLTKEKLNAIKLAEAANKQ